MSEAAAAQRAVTRRRAHRKVRVLGYTVCYILVLFAGIIVFYQSLGFRFW